MSPDARMLSSGALRPAQKPFYLSSAQAAEIRQLRTDMTARQKLAQLMCLYMPPGDITGWVSLLEQTGLEPGGVAVVTPRTAPDVRSDVAKLQLTVGTPLLVAANLESGSQTTITGDPIFANPMQIGATGNPEWAERLARICATAAHQTGINWAFAPVVDLLVNHRNPIINTRAFGTDAELVADLAEVFVATLERQGIATSVKHFPGDGIDDRDQHLVTTTNSLSVGEWNATFGTVYSRMINAGATTVMVGHIRQPALSRDLRPELSGRHILPGTLSPELITDLLRGRLGFNGLVVSDSTIMGGFTSQFGRSEGLARTIMAGCDVLLGTLDPVGDWELLVAALELGAITQERLDEAVDRVLACKMSLGLFGTRPLQRDLPDDAIDAQTAARWRRELAAVSVTLVKDTTPLLPLSAERFKRVLVYVIGDRAGFANPEGGLSIRFVEQLRERDMDVEVRHVPGHGDVTVPEWMAITEQARRLHEHFDLAIYFGNLRHEGNSNVIRVQWATPRAWDAPRDALLPMVLVSIADPFMLQDIPAVQVAINGYTPSAEVVDQAVRGLFGEAQLDGASPVDPFGGYWDASL